MFWDTHMHTSFSTDSSTPPDVMVKEALHLGLDGICITDHLDYDYPCEPGTPSTRQDGFSDDFLLDTASYFPSMKALQTQYADSFNILIGIELGLQPHLGSRYRSVLHDFAFDFVIGSSHVVHGQDPYYPQYYEGKTEEEAYIEYFSSILENIDAFHDFDVYGHIDYVVRYGPNRNAAYSYAKYADILDAILQKLISLGKGIEVNTAGFKHGLGHPNPTEDIIKRYRELGGEIITVGSDAHKPEHIAYDFHKLPGILKEAGFSYYTVFKNRKPTFITL